MASVNSCSCSERYDVLDQPKRGDASDGIGRHAPGPRKAGVKCRVSNVERLASQANDHQHRRDKQELAGFDAEVEEQERHWYGILRQSDFAQRAGG